MPRYRRYKKALTRTKTRYSSHAVTFQNQEDTFSQVQNRFIAFYDFVRNTPDTVHPAPPKIKVKRVNVEGVFGVYDPAQQVYSPGLLLVAEAIIMYIPQIVVSSLSSGEASETRESFFVQLVADHPEWIMGRKYIPVDFISGVPSIRKATPFKLSTYLSRNLNSGDSIMLIMAVTSHGSAVQVYQIAYEGRITYFTRDN